MREKNSEHIRDAVRETYAKVAQKGGSCCGSTGSSCCNAGPAEKTGLTNGYTAADRSQAPEGADLGLGCGNPLAFAGVEEGQTVLDLGSGAGFDCFIASGKVGPNGKVIGLDMTEEMVARARRLAADNGYENVEFLTGAIEDMPLEDNSVDWVISNCVVNLSPEKDKVFAEAYRVLKPGGHILISDVVVENMPETWQDNIAAWASCVAGALSEERYLAIITKAGFLDVTVKDKTEFFSVREPESVSVSSIRVSGVKPFGID